MILRNIFNFENNFEKKLDIWQNLKYIFKRENYVLGVDGPPN